MQANELGMHAIGVDISIFNALISHVKLEKYNVNELRSELTRIWGLFQQKICHAPNIKCEQELLEQLNIFNKRHFPTPDFRRRVRANEIDEKIYAYEKEREFAPIFEKLIKKYNLRINPIGGHRFMDKWFLQPVREEIYFLLECINSVQCEKNRKILEIILSRTVRSCRATTHADLATLKEPITQPYYCKKHGKMCKPLFSAQSWWRRYSEDTLNRIQTFNNLRTGALHVCVQGDSRTIDLIDRVAEKDKKLADLASATGIHGIFTSPPYIGLIDYHEQHAYAYDLFGYPRNDQIEIGPLYKGQSAVARKEYVESIAAVLRNCKKYLKPDYDVFVVANDKYNLYPSIANSADMRIVHTYKRPVLNRTEKDNAMYAEMIFHLK